MKPWESVVVGVDFSDSSRAALREAARLAHWQQCRLHVAHTISLDKDYKTPPETSAAISILRDRVAQELKEFCLEEIEFLTTIEYHILVGHPFKEMCQLTRDIAANLLVLGSCDQTGNQTHAGPIATNCIRKAPVPVLLVRTTHDNPYQDILVAIDFSRTSRPAVEIAADIAFENQSRLHLVHVHEPLLRVEDYAFCDLAAHTDNRKYQAEREQVLSQLAAFEDEILAEYPDLNIQTHLIHHPHVAEALVRFVRNYRTGLAVLGTRGRSRIRNLLLGTTAERLIHDCPCSVLAVKSDDYSYAV